MRQNLFANHQTIQVHAIYLGQRLELKNFTYTNKLKNFPLTITAGQAGCTVLFRYGVVVMVGLTSMEQAALIEDIKAFVLEPFEAPETEMAELVRRESGKEGVENSSIYLQDFSIERLVLVADILAKSVVLAHYEQNVAKSFDDIEPLATSLKERGHGYQSARELLKYIGDILFIQGKMVGRVEVTEKPELLWEHPELERLYLRLEDEFELTERHLALERKLELTSRTAGTLLDLLQTNRSLRVEWYIVILIVVDILLTLYDKFLSK
ncbi:MAG: RMD1 family protein [Gammaproteobacteria bacterium]|nr:RMD1 family protein [Gammaproteobacteria bacterium]MDH5651168.1 RMD1 family protein [Gammaproteobacteria bacterium]